MLSITKLQNLKAIHNMMTPKTISSTVVINHKTTKFESNSQHARVRQAFKARCYQSQNYKIWKQFTTQSPPYIIKASLLSITKLQKLKAIHNSNASTATTSPVVINHKTTKFESNSQLRQLAECPTKCCYQSQNYKIWKQFTTDFSLTG